MPAQLQPGAAERPTRDQARVGLRPSDSPPTPGALSSHRGLRAAAAGVALVAGIGGLVVLLPVFSVEVKDAVNVWVYPVASLGAGLALAAAAWIRRGRARRAWFLLALGVLSWAIGEIGSEFYWAAGREVPYPGWVDVPFLLAYPLIGAGVMLLPRPRLGRFERTRSILDATVGVVALSLLAWFLYLDRAISMDPSASLLENWTNALYPIGDAVLLLAVLGLAFSRTERPAGRDLLLLGTALALNAIADIAYFPLIATGEYSDGMWLDGVWLLGYAALAAAGQFAMQPSRPAAKPPGRPVARLAVAYSPVLVLSVIYLVSETPGRRYLAVVGIGLGALIVTRQWVTTRETREVVEESRDTILASVSHDLRTPLSAVLGYSQILAGEWDDYSPSDRQEMLRTIQDQAVHLSRLVTDIIDVTRGRVAAVVLSRCPCPADRLLHRAVAALPPADAAVVEFEAGPGLLTDADPDRVHQVLVNLLTNALRYGRPPVLARAERAGQYVAFQVHDAGPGVPKRYEASIWQRFDRGAFRHEAGAGGLGIGLAIARTIVEAHGGSIGHQRSERLGGACFEFTLPAAPLQPEASTTATLLREGPMAASVPA